MSEKATFTPGPWAVTVKPKSVALRFGPDVPRSEEVGTRLYDDESDAETIANFTLAGAAPELLAACQYVLTDESRQGDGTLWPQTRDMIRAAIAKATSR